MKKALLLCSIALIYVLLIEWALFGRGHFWSLKQYGTDMPARWSESMRIGGYLADVSRNPPQHQRLIAIGSSVLAAGFLESAFAEAWAGQPDVPPVKPYAAPLSGCTLYEALMVSQIMSEPPPDYVLLGFARRDVMPVMPRALLISKQAFAVPKTLPARSHLRNAGRESWAQNLWRSCWPAYRHRILAQQFAAHARPALRSREVAATDEVFLRADEVRMDGADVPLLAPWAAWCRSQDIQPILVMMPVTRGERRAAQGRDGHLDYVRLCADVARPNGIWFFNFSDAIPDRYFRDGAHLLRPGAELFAPLLAEEIAARVRTAARPRE